MFEERIEIIGIDHGWSNIKTANHVFISGVKEMSTEPVLQDNLIKYQNTYYKIGTSRMEVKDTKVVDESYYILTLAALAKELKMRGKTRAKVVMGVGLLLTRFGAEKRDFIDYLSRQKEVHFKFEGEHFNIRMEKVMIYPQCYGAVVDKIGNFNNNLVIVDIGSWTIDIMPVINQIPDEANCKTIPRGLITCIREINDEMVRVMNGEIPENMIEEVMRYGTVTIGKPYLDIMTRKLTEFAERIYNTLKELGFNSNVSQIVFVGGGASVMKHFGRMEGENISFIEDVRANAKGYEYLTKMSMRGKAGL